MGQGERIERIKPCPLTPSIKRSLRPQGIKMSLNLHSGPIPILVTVSLALILMAIGLAIGVVIFFMWVPVDWWPSIHGSTLSYDLFMFAAFMWVLVITLTAVYIMRRLRPNLFTPPILVEVSLGYILMAGGLVIFWMVQQIFTPEYDDGSLGTLVSILLGT
ncbi:MAG: hypothetical protein ACFFDM_07255 [Candidatus Thorarchaeota archaeon]